MGVQCCVINCKGKVDKERGIRLFCVPSVLKNQCSKTTLLSERRRAFWIERINKNLRDEDVKQQTRVCSRHFVTGQTAGLFDYKKPDWAPTLFMGYDQTHLDNIIQRQQLSLLAEVTKLEASLQLTINSSSVKSASDIDSSENICNGDIQIVESIVCEPSVNEISQVCENAAVEDISDHSEDRYSQDYDMLPDRTCLVEGVVGHKVELKEVTEENKLLYQKLSECEQDIQCLKTQVDTLREHNNTLITTVHNLTLHEETLRNDDSKVAYYTGLPSFNLLMHVFELVSIKVPDSPLYVLPKFQQCLMVLMRLRLNLQEQDLAYRFNVHVSTVNRIFYRWLLAMADSLEQFIKWPDRESLITSMPLCFKREWSDSVAVIIDCFEVFTDTSSLLLSKATTSSQLKYGKSVKFLIGIAPQGLILYISPAYDGSKSDKCIVEECGILNHLLPNDVLMAGRGVESFTGAQLVIPVFSKGGAHLCYNDTELTRKVANVGFYMERLIRFIRNRYSILKSVLPEEFLNKSNGDECALIDHVVRVCCALTNLCPPISPSE